MPKINTYTDNATIEDVDAVLTYDPAGSGATKLTTFGRIATWVSTKLAGLAKRTTISSADQILMVNGSAANRIDYNVLAKAILEEYAASTLAGSAQSVKAALETVSNSSLPKKIPNNTDLDTLTTKGHYYNDSGSSYTILNSPVNLNFNLEVFSKGTTTNQLLFANDNRIYYRTQFSNGWNDWRLLTASLVVQSKEQFLAKMTSLVVNDVASFYGFGSFAADMMPGGTINSGVRGVVSRTTGTIYDFLLEAYPHKVLTGRYNATDDTFTFEEFARQESFYFGNATGSHEFTLESNTCYIMVIHRINSATGTRGAGMYIISAHSGNSNIVTVVEPVGFTPTIALNKLSLTIDSGTETYVKVSLVKLV